MDFPDFNATVEQEKQQQQQAVRSARYKEYLEMASHDKFRIYNPLEDDFFIEWGGVRHEVPNRNRDMGYGKGQMRVERFLMAWYAKHMTDRIINLMNDKKIDEQMQVFTKNNPQAILTPYEQNQKINDRTEVRLDDLEARKKIINVIILGLEERYGQMVDDAHLFDKGTDNDLNNYANSRVYNPSNAPVEPMDIPVAPKAPELPHPSTSDLDKMLGIEGIKPQKAKTSKPAPNEI